MADCGLPFPVVCIQCGRGVGLCGIKIIGKLIIGDAVKMKILILGQRTNHWFLRRRGSRVYLLAHRTPVLLLYGDGEEVSPFNTHPKNCG